jgi:hypothetical protein
VNNSKHGTRFFFVPGKRRCAHDTSLAVFAFEPLLDDDTPSLIPLRFTLSSRISWEYIWRLYRSCTVYKRIMYQFVGGYTAGVLVSIMVLYRGREFCYGGMDICALGLGA